MFEEPEAESDGNATRAVKRLYASCMDVGESRMLQEKLKERFSESYS